MTHQPPRSAFLALGFRPFYLMAAVYALLALPGWLASYFGWIAWDGYLQGISWHSHEMIFGFESAELFRWLGEDLQGSIKQPYDEINRAGLLPDVDPDGQLGFLMRTALDAQVSSARRRLMPRPA